MIVVASSAGVRDPRAYRGITPLKALPADAPGLPASPADRDAGTVRWGHEVSINALNIALQRYEGTVLLVTHDQDVMEEVGTRVWHFDGGVLVAVARNQRRGSNPVNHKI